jgi:hypothetical protein
MRAADVDGAAENTGKQTLMSLDKSHVFDHINDAANNVHNEDYSNGVIHTVPDSEDPEMLLGVLLRKYPKPPLFAPF